jgi:hypothetical protein
MSEQESKVVGNRWGDKAKGQKRRDLDEAAAKKAGYPGALREQPGWYRGARVIAKAK